MRWGCFAWFLSLSSGVIRPNGLNMSRHWSQLFPFIFLWTNFSLLESLWNRFSLLGITLALFTTSLSMFSVRMLRCYWMGWGSVMLFKFCTISRDCGKSTIQKCSKINLMCFSVPNQMFYLLRGSNPVLCVSLHQFRKAQRSNPMCFAVPNSKCVIFSRDQVQYYVPLCTNSVALPFQRINPG